MNPTLYMLLRVYREHGEFKLWNIGWWNHVPYSECTDDQRLTARMRSIFDDEVALDLEDPAKLEELVASLKIDGYKFTVWSTGSRGYHVHLLVPQLAYFKEADRKAIRKLFILKYGCDAQKQTGLIAIEDVPHFKTGKPKRLVETHHPNGDMYNQLPDKIYEDALRITQKKLEFRGSAVTVSNDFLKSPFVDYCLSHQIPDGTGRYATLIKNLGIGLGLCGASDEELIPIIERLTENMPGRKTSDFWGWIRAARAGKYRNYNPREILRWLNEKEEEL